MPLFLALVLILAGDGVAAQQIDTLALRAHTRFLADDALAGRGTGSEGERIAALYIESQARRIGLRPGGINGSYLQPVPLREARITASQLTVRTARDSLSFKERAFVLNTGGERGLRSFDGPALFVGTVEHARAAADSAFRGRVLVLLGTLAADAQNLVPRWLHAGVAGVILLIPDSAQFQLFARSRGTSRFYIAADVAEPVWQSALPIVLAGPEVTRALLGDISGALGRLSSAGAFAPVDLNRSVHVYVRTDIHSIPAANVIATITGRDPTLRMQYIVYTAHYDHLGISTPDAQGDSIYNGFSDNAAGVAMLLTIAEQFERQPPARSVAFVFFTGEERGLLGSTYFASQPTIPLRDIVGVINLDAGAPPAPPIDWRLAGGASSSIGAAARDVATRRSWRIELSEASPNSDYWPFHVAGIPAVFLIPGSNWEGKTAVQRDLLRARWDRYHRADDEWDETFPFSGLQRYAELAMEIGRAIGNAPERPQMIRKNP